MAGEWLPQHSNREQPQQQGEAAEGQNNRPAAVQKYHHQKEQPRHNSRGNKAQGNPTSWKTCRQGSSDSCSPVSKSHKQMTQEVMPKLSAELLAPITPLPPVPAQLLSSLPASSVVPVLSEPLLTPCGGDAEPGTGPFSKSKPPPSAAAAAFVGAAAVGDVAAVVAAVPWYCFRRNPLGHITETNGVT